MNVKKLIAQLEKANPEDEVIISADSEGNDFGILFDVSGLEGEIRYTSDEGNDLELFDMSDKEEPAPAHAKSCVILFP